MKAVLTAINIILIFCAFCFVNPNIYCKVSDERYGDIDEFIYRRDFDKAEKLCKEIIFLNPRDYIAIAQLGEVYWERNNRRKAIKLFKKAVKLNPDYPNAHFLLGRAYIFQKKYEKGLGEFDIFKQKMESLSGMDEQTIDYYVAALGYIAYMHSTLKQYDNVMEECQHILKLRPDDQKAHYNLAICYYLYYHKRNNAYGELQKVIEIDPDTYLAKRAKLNIEFMRNNPDSRFMEDFEFIYKDE